MKKLTEEEIPVYNAEEMVKNFKEHSQLMCVDSPIICTYIVAIHSKENLPLIWIQGSAFDIGKMEKWTVVSGPTKIMNIEDGVFEHVTSRAQVEENSFDTPEEAFETFRKFYDE